MVVFAPIEKFLQMAMIMIKFLKMLYVLRKMLPLEEVVEVVGVSVVDVLVDSSLHL